MFCRNCGEQYQTDEAVICVKCGTAKGQGVNFCHFCGKPVNPQSNVCMNCGVALRNASMYQPKSKIAAGLLGIFLGSFGAHNFYLGYTKKAVTQLVLTIVGILLSCIIVGAVLAFAVEIWGLVEGIMILCGKINTDANGNYLTD